MRNPKFILNYILVLLLLIGFNIIQFFPQNVNNTDNNNENSDDSVKPNGIIYDPFIVGTGSGPYDLDPTDSWDSYSNDVVEQVVETLFTYNVSQFDVDQTMPRVNWLATGYSWDVTKTILTVNIRSGVTFHDGTPMNATAVAWSFNRFMYLMNHTGQLGPYDRAVKVHTLYEFPDGSPIFDSVVATDTYEVTFTLNAPYAPILDAMCYISCGILSPISTPATEIIDLETGDIVGTGPFKYDYYITDTEVHFTAFDEYWNGKANFDEMIYEIIDDPNSLNKAMLNGDIDFLSRNPSPAYFSNFTDSPNVTVYESNVPGLIYQYLAFNTHQINITWRKAMSYAINYTSIIEDLLEGEAFRAYGCISPGYGSAFNHMLRDAQDITPGVGTAVYDLSIARQTLIDDSNIHTGGLTANDDPNDAAWEAANLATFNYSYNTDNQFRTDLFVLLYGWFDDIGISLIDGGTDWGFFLLRAYGYIPGGFDQLQIYSIGWDPDYLDPFNMIDPLYSNISRYNSCQINDPFVQSKLSEALETINQTTRRQIYWDIQWRLYAELYVNAPLFHNKIYYVYSANVTNFPHNVLNIRYFYPCEFVGGFSIIPSITISTPFDGDGFAEIAPTFDLTVVDYDTIWYTLDGGITNTTCGTSGQIDPTLWGSLADNTYTLRFYVNSSDGLINSTAISIYKDTTDPVIVINDPDPYDEYLLTVPLYDIDITELHLLSAWYTLNGGTAIPLISYSGNIDETAWNALPYEEINITFYAADDLGNIGSSYVTVYKLNPTPASITINLPNNNQGFGDTAPMFDLTVTGYDSIWYTLDGGLTNITCGTSGQIDPTIWGGLDDGTYTLRFYANTSAGIISYDEGSIYKDTARPFITIIEPDSGDEYTTIVPIYEVTVSDLHVDSVWYTMDDGVTNISITEYLGTIDETAWKALANGYVTITFYAMDEVGNLGSASVIVYKNRPSAPPGIPGPYPILIIAILFVGVLGLTWRRKQNLN